MSSGTSHIPHNYHWAIRVAINLMGSKVTRIGAVKLHLHGQLSYKEQRGKAERCRAILPWPRHTLSNLHQLLVDYQI